MTTSDTGGTSGGRGDGAGAGKGGEGGRGGAVAWAMPDRVDAHGMDLTVTVAGDRLRVVRMAPGDDEPVVTLDVDVTEIHRTSWAVLDLPRADGGGPDHGGGAPGAGAATEQALVLDIVLADPEFDRGHGPHWWTPVRVIFPLDAMEDVRQVRRAINMRSARRRLAPAPGPEPAVAPSAPPGETRADLAAAVGRMNHRDAPSTAALAHLAHYPRPDEVVLEVMAATHWELEGVLAVTTTRILFAHSSRRSSAAFDYPVEAVAWIEPLSDEGRRASGVLIHLTADPAWYIGAAHAHWADLERFIAALRYAIDRRRYGGATLPRSPSQGELFRQWEDLTLAREAGTVGEEEFARRMTGIMFAAGY